tara:strand:- start:1599 stop:2522 length:924 start_codon:yes stop_codon:yes gene_type:complete
MQDFLEHAAKKYYEGEPVLTDEEFDRLASLYNAENVGYQVTDGVPHYFQMYSLQKFTSKPTLDMLSYAYSPKLDGAAVSLLYVGGELQKALTRGDGKVGKDVTNKVKHLVPNTIGLTDTAWVLQITGEIVAPASIPNARNYAAGALNLKSEEEFLERNVNFIAYDTQPAISTTWTGAMQNLLFLGFATVQNVQDGVYPTDGEVYRLDNYKKFQTLGYTAHHPRGAFALKEQKKGVVTQLLDVDWQIGKSGVVSPVAILAPIKIGDAVVERATLHNIEYIRGLNLEIGCSVEVIRSGEIIPRILRRVD